MPHIHNQPNQHDTTISTYIVMLDDIEPKFLLHMHKKFGKIIQLGGHVELDETPWQTVAHELIEESGYSLDELSVLQPFKEQTHIDNVVVAPVPFILNTFKVNDEHYHDDLGFVFVAKQKPKSLPQEGESSDLRWLTIDAMKKMKEKGEISQNIIDLCSAINEIAIGKYYQISATTYSLDKPEKTGLE